MDAAEPASRDATIREILAQSRRIAVVGASSSPARPSHGVVARLLRHGYDLTPVNPNETEVHDLPAQARLADVPGTVDLVDVFRAAEHAPDVAREAAAIGARALWLQQGVRSAEAAAIAADAGLLYVEDACLANEVDRVARERPLPPP